MNGTIHVFDYLDSRDSNVPPVCVVFGDEPFLKRQALLRIRQDLFENRDSLFTTFEGAATDWIDVADELSTVSLFGRNQLRLVVVEDAEPFLTTNRSRLEKYVEEPSSAGVLVLVVRTWASNTRLYKAIDRSGLQIECRPPEEQRGRTKLVQHARIKKWMEQWAEQQHQVQLTRDAIALLYELVGPEFGLLDQELTKLALYVPAGGKVSAELVRDMVGGWRTKTTWELIDAAIDGRTDEALVQLNQLLLAGEAPQALFGQIAWSFRRYAAAMRHFEAAERAGRPESISQALTKAGIRDWPRGTLRRSEQWLKRLGRRRAGSLYQWLLEADLALKGSHSHEQRGRWVLERLLLRVAGSSQPTRAVS